MVSLSIRNWAIILFSWSKKGVLSLSYSIGILILMTLVYTAVQKYVLRKIAYNSLRLAVICYLFQRFRFSFYNSLLRITLHAYHLRIESRITPAFCLSI
jgi:hypothetical protein